MQTNDWAMAVNKVIQHLAANGFYTEADELKGFLADALANKPSSAGAIKAIHDRCHIKWLGDLSIQELTFKEWIDFLEQVKSGAGSPKFRS